MPHRSASPTNPYRAARLAAALLLLAAGAAAEGTDPPAPSGAEATEQADEKFGLSEAQRKDVFTELADAEDRAEREAAAQFQARPESEAQATRTDQLLKRYRAAIAKAHGLTEGQLVEIQAEGFRKSWRTVVE